jgi:predicted dehydrogenase
MEKIDRKSFLINMGTIGAAAVVAPSLFAFNTESADFKPFNRKVRVGIIGCGSVSRMYLPHLSNCQFAEIVSLCDIKPERAEKKATDFKVANWYPHIDQMLAGVPFDLLVNLTNMQEHGRLNRIAINAGKYVWSEKPMANSYKEGKELFDLALNNNLRIWGAPAVVNSPQFAFMAKQINSGNMGILCAGHGSYGHEGPNWSSFFYEKLGGSMPDLGVYNIATLVGLLGPAVSVTSILNIVNPTREITDKGTIKVEEEDNAHILLEHKNGAISHIQCGFNYLNSHSYEGEEIATLSVVGSKAKMDMIGYDWFPFAVEMATTENRKLQRYSTDRGTYLWQEGASVICEYLSTGKEPLINAEHALHVLEIIEAARESNRSRTRIDLKSTFKWPIVV